MGRNSIIAGIQFYATISVLSWLFQSSYSLGKQRYRELNFRLIMSLSD